MVVLAYYSILVSGQEFCVRFFYNIPAGTDSELKVYQLRTRIVPNQERLEVGDNFFTKDGEWREARINAHGWDTTDLVRSVVHVGSTQGTHPPFQKKPTMYNSYCGIIIDRGGSMFVDIVGYPYPRIIVPKNVSRRN